MALQGVLTLDTAPYERAMRSAREELQKLGLGADDAGKKAASMLRQFNPADAIQKAHALAAAVQEMGGAANFTTQQNKSLSASIEKGLAAYKQLGERAPDDMRRLAAETAALSRGTDAHGKSIKQTVLEYAAGLATWDLARSAVTGVARAFQQAFVATLELGDTLSNMSAKTGMSVEALQKLRFAGASAGVGLDAMANASAEMGKRIADGDKGALKALNALGISLRDFKSLSADQQILAINSALLNLADTSQRNAVEAALFGKAWKEIAPAMASDLTELGKKAEDLGAVLDSQTVAAIDTLGDSLDQAKVAGEGFVARFMLPFIDGINTLSSKLSGVVVNIGDLAETLGRVAAKGGSVVNPMTWLNAWDETQTNKIARGAVAWRDLGEEMKATMLSSRGVAINLEDTSKANEKAAREAEKHTAALAKLTGTDKVQAAAALVKMIEEVGGISKIAASNYAAINKELTEGITVASELGVTVPNAWISIARATDTAVEKLGNYLDLLKQLPSYAEKIPVPAPNAMGWGIPGVVDGFDPASLGWGAEAATGKQNANLPKPPGFNWAGLGFAGLNGAMPFLSQLVTGGSRSAQIGGSIAGSLGGALGSVSSIATALGGFAPFLGPAAGIVGSLIGKMFGPSQGKLASQDRSAYLASVGGSEGFNEQFRAAGVSPEVARALTGQFLSANTQKDVQAAIEKINATLRETSEINAQILDLEGQRKALAESLVPTYEQVTAAAATLGIDVNALGPAVQQLGANEAWKSIIDALETIISATGDVGGALSQSAGTLSKMVQQAKAAGLALPENMKPYIEELARSGQLLDANGEKITDLSGIKWGEKIASQADIIKASMESLDATIQKLGDRLEAIARTLAGIPGAANAASTAVNGVPSGERPPAPYETEMASGGIVTRPTVALIGEAGPEAVVPLKRGVLRPIVVQLQMDGRTVTEVVLDNLGAQARVARRVA